MIIPCLINFVVFLYCFFVSLLCVGFIYIKIRYKRLTGEKLVGKHVVVTGGSSGIGKSLGCEAAARGANVTLVARDERRLADALQEVRKSCIDSSQLISSVSLDVTGDFAQIESDFAEIEKEGGPVFMLVNCAGAAVCGTLEDTSSADIRRMFNLNSLGSIQPTKAVITGMKERGEGHVVFVSSMAGLAGVYGYAAYSASKFALKGFAEALHMEVKHCGVKVTMAFPPDTDTPGFAEENKSKPKETLLISESSGLYTPQKVASQIMKDTQAGHFLSTIGTDGFLLRNLCAGFSPFPTTFHLIFEALFMSIFRIVAGFYLMSFDRIILDCKAEKNKSKKAK